VPVTRIATHPGPDQERFADQQPDWHDHPDLGRIRRVLGRAAAPVQPAEIREFTASLVRAAKGDAQLLQAGDCAESLLECEVQHVQAKLSVLDQLADRMTARAGLPTLRVGRLGGQFAKPRSAPIERCGSRELPVFRGHMVNGERPNPHARHHDPFRLLQAYTAAVSVTSVVAAHHRRRAAATSYPDTGPWTSHEALIFDYETCFARTDVSSGARYLTSTHLPWIGERTSRTDGPHVRFLQQIANPIGLKLGPAGTLATAVRTCARLDPWRLPGRLVLILRLGADQVEERLPPLVTAITRAGHRPAWLIDPMHGNTVRSSSGLKIRYLRTLAAEATAARRILERLGEHPAGMHLEVAAEHVTECIGSDVPDEGHLGRRYRTLCDPRLNPEQACELIDTWH